MKQTRRMQRGQSTLEYVLVGAAILVAVMAVATTQIGGNTGDTGAVPSMMFNAAEAMKAASGSIVTGTSAQGTRVTRGTKGPR